MKKPKGAYLLAEHAFDKIYGQDERDAIAALVNIEPRAYSRAELLANPQILSEVSVVFSGWGAPVLDDELLDLAPKLKAVFYGAGSVKSIIPESFWQRKILLTSAYVANARPVAEFTFAQIVFALKKVWQHATEIRTKGEWYRREDIIGAYFGTRVGIISLGAIGRLVVERLSTLDLEVLVYDPFVSDEEMRNMGVRKASLRELFEKCDVVSLHAPKLQETLGMIREEHFRLMPKGASFINTSRGAIVDEPGLIRVLEERPDLLAMLDVTDPEPPVVGSPLYTLPNVLLTPHIAGSMGRECRRMGRLAMDECRRYLAGEEPLWPITEENFQRLA
jgi:phosphoglycerate dehydrogenase-like enzyme